MRFAPGGRTLPGVPGSLTRRQLLIRTGGATVALTCFGALPGGAAAEPAALSSARAATYGAILDAINADPKYELADREERARRFAAIYAESGDGLRAYADGVLDELAHLARLTPTQAHDRLSCGALDLAALPYVDPEIDTHTIVFTV